ncbi:hypothetical protein BJX61DRAFT_103227 [Aspergillus egyptiacus]|nr:hypothetical protein BJX61DRAFT_103227 [Aspergillus egyptiacus]
MKRYELEERSRWLQKDPKVIIPDCALHDLVFKLLACLQPSLQLPFAPLTRKTACNGRFFARASFSPFTSSFPFLLLSLYALEVLSVNATYRGNTQSGSKFKPESPGFSGSEKGKPTGSPRRAVIRSPVRRQLIPSLLSGRCFPLAKTQTRPGTKTHPVLRLAQDLFALMP